MFFEAKRSKALCLVGLFLLSASTSNAEVVEILSEKIVLNDILGFRDFPERSSDGTFAIGDVNNDGNDDLVIGMFSFPDPEKGWIYDSKSILLTFDPKTKTYKPDLNYIQEIGAAIVTRRAEIEDFNGDGLKDIYIANPGSDGHGFPDCGGHNTMVLQTPQGWKNVDAQLPQVSDYTHGLTSADFNQDGKADILALNMPLNAGKKACGDTWDGSSASYFLGNLEGETFEKLDVKIKAKLLNLTEDRGFLEINTGEAGLLDNDSIPDLVLADAEKTMIIQNKGLLSYQLAAKFPISKEVRDQMDDTDCQKLENGKCYVPSSAILIDDFDNDGQNEIIVARATDKWHGQILQSFDRINKKWEDVTNDMFGVQDYHLNDFAVWCNTLFAVDVNNDGQKDLLCPYSSNFEPSKRDQVWINESGKFVGISADKYKDSPLAAQLKKIEKLPVGQLGVQMTFEGPAKINGVNYLIFFEKKWENTGGKVDQLQYFQVLGLPIN